MKSVKNKDEFYSVLKKINLVVLEMSKEKQNKQKSTEPVRKSHP